MLGAIAYEPLVRIHLGPLAVSPHGIATAIGFVAATMLIRPQARRQGLTDDFVAGLVTRAAIGAIVGARFFYVLNNLSSFQSPLEWFEVWEGGISLLGGIAGGTVANLRFAMRQGYRFFQVMDVILPGLALGIAIGRIGDLMIADHLGAPTTSPFGFRCPAVADVGRTVGSPCPPGEVVHLTALYDFTVVTLVLGLLLWLRRRPRPEGELTLVGAVAYGLGRVSFDFFREDVRRLGLTGSQWVAVGVVALAALVLAWRRIRATGAETAGAPPSRDAESSRGEERRA